MKKQFISNLKSRGIIRVSGNDGLKFLQSLVTADIHSICTPSANTTTATAFLDRRGRVLHGCLIHKLSTSNEYMIDVPKTQTESLMKHLKAYCLRSAVHIDDISCDYSVWQSNTINNNFNVHAKDPRLSLLGKRTILSNNEKNELDDGEMEYERLRIINGIPDGEDFIKGSLPLDLGLHLIGGVSFKKGCYLGQELTARSHFTGILRKRLTTIILSPPNNTNDKRISNVQQNVTDLICSDDEYRLNVGDEILVGNNNNEKNNSRNKKSFVITSAIDNIGVAVLKMSDILNDDTFLTLNDGRILSCIPQPWWDTHLSSSQSQNTSQPSS